MPGAEGWKDGYSLTYDGAADHPDCYTSLLWAKPSLQDCIMMAIKRPVFLCERSPSRMLDFKSARNYRIGRLLYFVACWLVVGLIAAVINRLLG